MSARKPTALIVSSAYKQWSGFPASIYGSGGGRAVERGMNQALFSDPIAEGGGGLPASPVITGSSLTSIILLLTAWTSSSS